MFTYCVCTVHIYYVYINKHTYMNIFKNIFVSIYIYTIYIIIIIIYKYFI